jgi:hypothetical protein
VSIEDKLSIRNISNARYGRKEGQGGREKNITGKRFGGKNITGKIIMGRSTGTVLCRHAGTSD